MTASTTNAPIAIGGLGGSSTRAVAECLANAGVDMGFDLNEAVDDQLFTLLFKRRDWVCQSRRSDSRELRQAMEVFVALRQGHAWPPRSRSLIAGALLDAAVHGTERPSLPRRAVWSARRAAALRRRPRQRPRPGPWGWKEPNTALFVDVVSDVLPDARYVHVVRHGLDMAYSENRNQLRIWGDQFGLDRRSTDPTTCLEMWIRVNQLVVDRGRELFGSRFLLLNVDALSSDPVTGVQELVQFLQLDVTPDVRRRMEAVPRQPSSTGRYRDHDLGAFSTEQLDAVRSFGFEVSA